MGTESLKLMDRAINSMHTNRTIKLQRISVEGDRKILIYDPEMNVMQVYDKDSVWMPDATPAEQIIRDAREK
ncbi:MAG TPA: hypothetical protein VFQ54_11540 [Thermomicrobiales bacterium]|nr:hypothetical protein [Thermomicrobiales bacterium]